MLPDDVYGNVVTMQTVGGNDIYTSGAGYSASVLNGTSAVPAYISLAIQCNLGQIESNIWAFLQTRYDDFTRTNLQGLYANAYINGLTNRLAYLAPLLSWEETIYAYIAGYATTVRAMTNPTTIAATSPDFSSFIATDPELTALGALMISN